LVSGSIAALVWANLDLTTYSQFINTSWFNFELFGRLVANHGYSLHFLVNEAFMVLFFGIAMKEVTEAFLPGGPLASVRKASLPVISTLGGVAGPAIVFVLGCTVFAKYLMRGWAVPTATDIAYSWLFAGLIFGYKHPATKFLLALAVLDDLIGMVIIAIFYSSSIQLPWMLLVALAVALCAAFRWIVKVESFWPYLIVCLPLSWLGLHYTGVHAALALVPIIPLLPHERSDRGIFEEEDLPIEEGSKGASGRPEPHHDAPGHHPTDALNMFEHQFKPFVDVGLFFFGFANAGVPFSAIGLETWITVAAIFLGKTFGIYLFSVLGRLLRFGLPAGMTMREAFVMGNVAAIGFTVALFVTDVAFPRGLHGHGGAEAAHATVAPGHEADRQHAAEEDHATGSVVPSEHAADESMDATAHATGPVPPPHKDASFEDLTNDQQGVVKDKVKMGALLSFAAGLTAMLLARLLGVRKINTDAELAQRIRELGATP
jgi:NhaA family Na+:H+ antiporter